MSFENGSYLKDRTIFLGVLALVFGLGGFLAWASLAQLAQGVIGIGALEAQSKRKTIQHLEGGIIADIGVSDGKTVTAGEVLLSLTDSVTLARKQQVDSDLKRALIRRDRLRAEFFDRREISISQTKQYFPEEKSYQEVLDFETTLMLSRLGERATQLSVYEAKIDKLRLKISSEINMKDSISAGLAIMRDELRINQEALRNQMGRASVVNDLTLKVIEAQSQITSTDDRIASYEAEIYEVEKIAQNYTLTRKNQVAEELEKSNTQIARLLGERAALIDVIRRSQVLAPISGRVFGLRFTTIGGVIPAGKPIMDIVPDDEEFLVKAQFSAQYRDDLVDGQDMEISFTSFDAIAPPTLTGKLLRVSADSIVDERSAGTYYEADIAFDAGELVETYKEKLVSGVPVSVFATQTTTRTPLSYFLEPVMRMIEKGISS